MSDDPIQADEAGATEQGSGGEQSHDDRSWLVGEPDPERLVSYASNLRKERADLKERLTKADVWDDEEAVFARVQERFPHWLDAEEEQEEDDEEFDDDDPRDRELRELRDRQKAHDEWIAQQNAEKEKSRFEGDLQRFVGDRELSARADRAIRLEAATGSLGPKDLERLVNEWVEYEDGLRQSGIEHLRSSKKAPHVPAGGKAGSGPKHDTSTTEGRTAFFKDRLGQQP